MIRKSIIVLLTLAAVGTAVGWVASYFRFVQCDGLIDQKDSLGVVVRRGTILIDHARPAHFGIEPLPSFPRCSYLPDDGRGQFETYQLWHFDFHRGTDRFHSPVDRIWVEFPLWIPAILFAAYPTIALIRGPLRRRRWRRKGLCVKCGYDLTGNESGVCPECGESTFEAK